MKGPWFYALSSTFGGGNVLKDYSLNNMDVEQSRRSTTCFKSEPQLRSTFIYLGGKNTIFFFCVALEPMYDQPKIKCHFIFFKIRTVVNAGWSLTWFEILFDRKCLSHTVKLQRYKAIHCDQVGWRCERSTVVAKKIKSIDITVTLWHSTDLWNVLPFFFLFFCYFA